LGNSGALHDQRRVLDRGCFVAGDQAHALERRNGLRVGGDGSDRKGADRDSCGECGESHSWHCNPPSSELVVARVALSKRDREGATLAAIAAPSGRPDQSGLRPANLTTLPHFSVSSSSSVRYSVGESGRGSLPRSAIRALMVGSARPALMSRLSVSMISAGVWRGAPRPWGPLAS